jgi:hypothetical protein
VTREEAEIRILDDLEKHSLKLTAKLSNFLNNLPFEVIDSGFSKKDINGIHFEYEIESFTPIACPLNTAKGYCGAGEVIDIVSDEEEELLPFERYEDLIDVFPPEEKDEFEENLLWMLADTYEKWFMRCWKQARGLKPNIRGFISPHDSWYRIDLDDGNKFEEGTGEVKFF